MVVVEPTGAEVQVFARLDGQDITAVLRERLLFKPGEIGAPRARSGAGSLFDAADRQATLNEDVATKQSKRGGRR